MWVDKPGSALQPALAGPIVHCQSHARPQTAAAVAPATGSSTHRSVAAAFFPTKPDLTAYGPCRCCLPQAGTFSSMQNCSFTSPLSGNAIEVSAAETRAVADVGRRRCAALPFVCLRPYHQLLWKCIHRASTQDAVPRG
jgi:hypothetical protein